MAKIKVEQTEESRWQDRRWRRYHGGGSGAVYGLGLIGGLIYAILHWTSLEIGLWGIVHALFWPAFLVYKMFELLKF